MPYIAHHPKIRSLLNIVVVIFALVLVLYAFDLLAWFQAPVRIRHA